MGISRYPLNLSIFRLERVLKIIDVGWVRRRGRKAEMP